MEYAGPWFESAFEGRAEGVAVEDGSGSLSAATLAAEARSVAGALAPVRPKVVGIAIEPGCDWVVALHAAWLCGASALPIEHGLDSSTRGVRASRCDLVLESLPERVDGFEPVSVGPLAPAVVLYTSGTTADAEEVVLSHSNLIAQGVASREALCGTASDRWLSSLSPAHAGGLAVLARCAAWGATAVTRPRFDCAEFLELLSDPRSSITVVSLVPVMLERLLDAGLADPPSLRRALVSGAPLRSETKERAIAAGIPVVEAWGMTETCGMATVERMPGEGGAGSPLPGIHVETSEEGEIRVGGATVAPGVQVGGMFDSGDLGEMSDGRLAVTGRKSSLIITGGENVSPERVEAVLASHPLVSEARVFGEQSAEWGEAVACELVLAGDCPDSDLRAHCRERLAAWEVPKRFSRVDAIRRTASGKVIRRQVTGGG